MDTRQYFKLKKIASEKRIYYRMDIDEASRSAKPKPDEPVVTIGLHDLETLLSAVEGIIDPA